MNSFLLIMFAMTFMSAFSQLLLKLSANETHARLFGEYLNKKVITAYILFATVLFVDTYAYTKVDLKYGAVIDAFTYVFVMLLSRLVLKERFSRWRMAGNAFIVAGIMIYTLQPFG